MKTSANRIVETYLSAVVVGASKSGDRKIDPPVAAAGTIDLTVFGSRADAEPEAGIGAMEAWPWMTNPSKVRQ